MVGKKFRSPSHFHSAITCVLAQVWMSTPKPELRAPTPALCRYRNRLGPVAASVFHMKPLIFHATLSVAPSGRGGHPPWLDRASLLPFPNLW
jgi:hypothetical protein